MALCCEGVMRRHVRDASHIRTLFFPMPRTPVGTYDVSTLDRAWAWRRWMKTTSLIWPIERSATRTYEMPRCCERAVGGREWEWE